MANDSRLTAEELTGLFIYQDHRKTIYQGLFMKDGYIITNRDVEKYSRYSLRLPIAMLAACLVFFLLSSILLTILAFIVVEFGIYLIFRYKFLVTLPVIENYKHPKKESLIVRQARNFSRIKCIIYIIFSILLIVVSVYKVCIKNEYLVFYSLLILMGVFILIFFILILRQIIINKRHVSKDLEDNR